MYIYECHMGGLYADAEDLDYEDLYCETCGDSDYCLGYADTVEEAWNILRHDVDIDCSGGWDLNYTKRFLKLDFDATDKQLEELVNKEIEWRKEHWTEEDEDGNTI